MKAPPQQQQQQQQPEQHSLMVPDDRAEQQIKEKMEEEGYEYMSRHRRSTSPAMKPTRIRRKSPSQSPPRNPSPLTTECLTQPASLPHQPQCAVSSQPQCLLPPDNECTFRPISVNEHRIRPNTVSVEHQTSSKPRRMPRPSSTTPDSRHRINYEPKIMSPTFSAKKPTSFRMLASEIHKLPNRCDNMEYFHNRSESLV